MSDTTTVTDVETNGKRKREEKIARMYFNATGGEIGPRCNNEAHAIKITLVKSGYSITLQAKDFNPDVLRAAALYGAANSITNAVGAKGLTEGEMRTALDDRYARLFEDGVWSEGATGPRTSDVFEAMKAVYLERGGEPTQDWEDKTKKKLADDPAYNKAMREKPAIAVVIESLKLQRQAAKLAAAEAEAKRADDDIDFD